MQVYTWTLPAAIAPAAVTEAALAQLPEVSERKKQEKHTVNEGHKLGKERSQTTSRTALLLTKLLECNLLGVIR